MIDEDLGSRLEFMQKKLCLPYTHTYHLSKYRFFWLDNAFTQTAHTEGKCLTDERYYGAQNPILPTKTQLKPYEYVTPQNRLHILLRHLRGRTPMPSGCPRVFPRALVASMTCRTITMTLPQ